MRNMGVAPVRHMIRVVCAALVLGVLMLTAGVMWSAPARAADPDDFAFRSMHADYVLGRDADGVSTLQVTETLVADFPQTDQNHGIRRVIPERNQDLPLDVKITGVTDGSGTPRTWEESSDSGLTYVTIAADGFVHGEQTYVISYMMRNVAGPFSDTQDDEFYWDVNGTAWAQPFGEVSMTLTLADGLESALTGEQACYRGEYGSSQRCEISHDDTTITAATSNLAIGENMSVAVAFAPETFTVPDTSYFAFRSGWIQSGFTLGALLFGVGGALFARRTFLRDARGDSVVIAQYEPPAHFDAFAAAVLLNQDRKGPTAELLEQAVRGAIRLVEVPRERGKPGMKVVLVDPTRIGDDDGADLVGALFGANPRVGAEYVFTGQDPGLAATLQRMQQRMRTAQERTGLRRHVPKIVRVLPPLLAIVCTVGAFTMMFPLLVSGNRATAVAGALVGISGIFPGIASFILVAKRPYSSAGAKIRDHLRGLEMFMRWAEADRIQMLQSRAGAERRTFDPRDPLQMLHLYEPLLPYAVVFGMEKDWGGLLETQYESAGVSSSWYMGPSGLHSGSLAFAMTSTASAMSLASSTASSSSSVGGASGGGFSGGGGGGGGGGGV